MITSVAGLKNPNSWKVVLLMGLRGVSFAADTGTGLASGILFLRRRHDGSDLFAVAAASEP